MRRQPPRDARRDGRAGVEPGCCARCADETLVLWLREATSPRSPTPWRRRGGGVSPPASWPVSNCARAAGVAARGGAAGVSVRAAATRQSNQTHFFRWLDTWQIPLRELRLQSEVYFCDDLPERHARRDAAQPNGEYLVERAEQMIRRREGGRAEQEARERRQLRSISAIALRRQQASQVQRGMLTEQTAMPPADSWPESTTIYPA